jgi:hypothetical protein
MARSLGGGGTRSVRGAEAAEAGSAHAERRTGQHGGPALLAPPTAAGTSWWAGSGASVARCGADEPSSTPPGASSRMSPSGVTRHACISKSQPMGGNSLCWVVESIPVQPEVYSRASDSSDIADVGRRCVSSALPAIAGAGRAMRFGGEGGRGSFARQIDRHDANNRGCDRS